MGQVIELCRTCGFDIPADAHGCPACRRPTPPPRAARQVSGFALPTRSVHALRTVRPARDQRGPLGRARAARSAFSFATALALLTFAAAGLAWVAEQPRFVLEVPSGTADALDEVTVIAATASVVGLGIGLAAMVVWCARALGRWLLVRGPRHS